MKVLVLSHVSDYVGGAERSILDVLDIWKATHGIEIEFILRKPLGSYIKELDKRGYKYYPVDYTYWNDSNPPRDEERLFTTARRNSNAVLSIEEIIKDSKPDLVITNSIVAPWAAFAAHFQQIPHVWFAREYGDLDHGRVFEIGRQNTFEDIGNLSTLVIVNSKTLGDHISQYIDMEKITTLYNPFNLDEIKALVKEKVKNPFKYKDSLKMIITSGGITPNKGQLEAITATGELNKQAINAELCIIGRPGTDEFMKKLNSIISDYELEDKVHFLGYQKNPLAFAATADVGIMASKQEAFGRVTFEYLAIGLPVVGARSGATPEIVDDTVNGQLFTPGSVKDLTDKLKLYSTDKTRISKHSKAATLKAKAMMDSEWNAENTYKRILKSMKEPKLTTPIHFTHRWLQYPDIAVNYINAMNKISLKRVIYLRLRQRVKPYYVFLRNLYARVTGK